MYLIEAGLEYWKSEMFVKDMELLKSNAERYNGKDNMVAHQARRILNYALELVQKLNP